MRSARIIALVLSALALCLPASAVASTPFTWSMPHDFTTAAPGSNPDHDAYGNTPWGYSASAGSLKFSKSFGPSFDPGLAGWSNNPGNPSDYIAVNPGSPSQLHMLPAMGQSVSVTWTSPYRQPVSVTSSGSAKQAAGGACLSTDVTTTLNGRVGLNQSLNVAAGGTITLTVKDTSLLYIANCDLEDVQLQLQVQAAQPNLTITSPAAGATLGGRPALSGSAGNGFGFTNAVSVAIYPGSQAIGTSEQTVSTTESGGSWSVTAGALQTGTYTAQAAQTDKAGNTWISAPVTFKVSVPVKLTGDPVGGTITLSHSGFVAMTVTCALPADQVCTGTVLVLTVHKFRTAKSGPKGQLRLVYAYVGIAGGQTLLMARRVSHRVMRALHRHHGTLTVQVRVDLSSPGGGSLSRSDLRRLSR